VKVIDVDQADLAQCIRQARREPVVLTRKGKPVTLLVGVEGLDLEQLELGLSDKFWTLIRERRAHQTMTREELERRLAQQEQPENEEGQAPVTGSNPG
jgi:hypothetical protein